MNVRMLDLLGAPVGFAAERPLAAVAIGLALSAAWCVLGGVLAVAVGRVIAAGEFEDDADD